MSTYPNRVVKPCKHCGLDIVSETGAKHTFRHAEGPQCGLNRCAVSPYGYDAETEDEPCSFACLGSGECECGHSKASHAYREDTDIWIGSCNHDAECVCSIFRST